MARKRYHGKSPSSIKIIDFEAKGVRYTDKNARIGLVALKNPLTDIKIIQIRAKMAELEDDDKKDVKRRFS